MDSVTSHLEIPPSIGKLKKLQTLCGALLCSYKFPREICELKELRHLDYFRGASLNIGSQQTKLQTLKNIRYDERIHIDTVDMRNLHTLSIIERSSTNCQRSLDSVSNLTSLQSFFLYVDDEIVFPTIKPISSCKRLKRVELGGSMTDESDLSCLPDSVTYLKLDRSNFAQDPMPTLGSLSSLGILHLENTVSLGEKLAFSNHVFPSLQYFILSHLSALEELQVEDGALPSLKGFLIHRCPRMKMIPHLLNCLPPLPKSFLRQG